MTATTLFTPLTLGPVPLANRVAMAPMTRSRADADGVPGELAATYYAQRASAGLIITEASQVSPRGVGYVSTPGIHSAAQIAGWRQVTDAVHAAGGRIFLQLWHVGRVSHPDFHGGALPLAPSAIGFAGEAFTPQGRKAVVTPEALTLAGIREVIEEFRQGAANAKAAGFDGVEVHGANGYLLDQFLQDGSNQRHDEYGGSVEHRARLLLEVTRAVIGVWGPGRVGVRLSPAGTFNGMSDSNPEAIFSYTVRQLNGLGLAYLHLMEGAGEPFVLDRYGPLFEGPVMINGGFDAGRAAAVLAAGKAALVSFGALFLANPDLPARLRRGAPFNAPDRSTFYGGGAAGYTDYQPYREAD